MRVQINIGVGSIQVLLQVFALTGKAPYKTVISHGFTLDGEGHKMSKSLGSHD
ncbi:MAG: class I tRNA ligase family protein [Christensenellales bacterium]